MIIEMAKVTEEPVIDSITLDRHTPTRPNNRRKAGVGSATKSNPAIKKTNSARSKVTPTSEESPQRTTS